MYTHRSPFGGTASICTTASHLRAQFRKGGRTTAAAYEQRSNARAQGCNLYGEKIRIHASSHSSSHARTRPSICLCNHPSIRACVRSTIHAVSQGRDNARFNKELAKVGHIPGVSGTSVKEITKTLTGIV
jgi:hypothetical protein